MTPEEQIKLMGLEYCRYFGDETEHLPDWVRYPLNAGDAITENSGEHLYFLNGDEARVGDFVVQAANGRVVVVKGRIGE